MRRGEQLNWIKNIVSTMNMAIPAHRIFLLTHTPIVGHGGKGTHYNRRNPDKDMDELFVKWVNGEFKFQKDPRVEAVFCGHTHLNRFYHDVYLDNMDDPYCYYNKGHAWRNYCEPLYNNKQRFLGRNILYRDHYRNKELWRITK